MENDLIKPGKLFWIVGILLLLWGLLGVFMFMTEMLMGDAAYLENFGETAMALREVVPSWSIAGYGIGVWFGLAGTLALLLRKSWAVPLYIISLLGAILGWSWYLINAQGRASLGENGGWFMLVLVMALCLFSIWWAKRQKSLGVLH